MSVEITAAVVGGFFGVITGGIASLAAPWAQWQVEQRRLRRAERVELIRSWREGAAAYAGAFRVDRSAGNFLEREPWLLSLRPLISDQGRPLTPGFLFDEIDRIQADWRLR